MSHFVHACFITLSVALCALLVGLVLGTALGWLLAQGRLLARFIAQGVTIIFRGLPELLMLFIVYYGGNALLSTLFPGAHLALSPFIAGSIALSFSFSGYAAQLIQAAVRAIPATQAESGAALGLSTTQTFFRILLPQMAQHALPGLGNLWQILLKDTALVSTLGLAELMQWAQLEANRIHTPFTYYLWAALMYAVFCLLSEYGLRRQQQRLRARQYL